MEQPYVELGDEPIDEQLSVSTTLREIRFDHGRDYDHLIEFARSVHHGLNGKPRTLQSKYLYDAKGSDLFEQICNTPEYYLTRTEEEILSDHSTEIAAITGPITLIELGAGTSRKTKILLNAYSDQQHELDYIAVDVSASALAMGQSTIRDNFSNVNFHQLCANWEQAFPLFSGFGRNMVIFLGSSVGNLTPQEFDLFFSRAAVYLKSGDFFLLGIDLHKDTEILEAAYNDMAGVTEAFTKNMFVRMNTELGSDINIDQVKHQASYNTAQLQIEIHAEFLADQEIHIVPLGLTHQVRKGDIIHTEVSRKFEADNISNRLALSGFITRKTFTDPEQHFALLLLERI